MYSLCNILKGIDLIPPGNASVTIDDCVVISIDAWCICNAFSFKKVLKDAATSANAKNKDVEGPPPEDYRELTVSFEDLQLTTRLSDLKNAASL